MQTVFMKVFTNIESYSGKAPVEHWVSRIAVNTCFNELKAERIRQGSRSATPLADGSMRIDRQYSSPQPQPGSHNGAPKVPEADDAELSVRLYLVAIGGLSRPHEPEL